MKRHSCANPHHEGEQVTLHLRLPAEDISTLLDDLRREAANGNVGTVGVPVRRLTHVTVGTPTPWWRGLVLVALAVVGAYFVADVPQPWRVAIMVFLGVVLAWPRGI